MTIRQRIILLLTMVLTAGYSWAGNIGADKAREKAIQFLAGQTAAARSNVNMPQNNSQLQLAESAQGGDYYIFNIGNQKGFVIVSGDDRTADILGYCDNGQYDSAHVPDAVKFLLNGYVSEMELADTDVPTTANARRMESRANISPMLTTNWDQGSPYNGNCPTVNGTHTETGCVAVAMAQIMYYHRWPTGATSAVPGYTPTDNNGNYTTPVVSSLPSTTFDWTKMSASYSAGSSAPEVAKLMYYSAASTLTWFRLKSVGGSGANPSKMPHAMMTYFGYESGAQYAQRKDYGYDDWLNLIYTEIAASRPVLLGGNNTTGGHAFVCDGYQNGFFHINWGWGGAYNGYFRLSLLDHKKPNASESTMGDGFNLLGIACVGIQPKGRGNNNPAVVPAPTGTPSLTVTDITYQGTLAIGQSKEVYVTIRNNGTGDYHGDITLGQIQNGYIAYMGGVNADVPRGSTVVVKIPAIPSSRAGNGTFELVVFDGYFNRGTRLSQKTVTVGSSDIQSQAELKINTFDVNCTDKSISLKDSKIINGNTLKGSVTLRNEGTTTYSLGLSIALRQVTKWTSLLDFTVTTVAERSFDNAIGSGSTQTLNYEFNGLEYDERYVLEISYYKYNGTKAEKQSEDIGVYLITRDAATVDNHAVVADLRGETNISNVQASQNPNCVYLLDASASIPSALAGRNVVRGNTATNITLTDGYDFRTPIAFVANTVTYSRTFNTSSNGHGGWTTIMLPFDVDKVTVDGIEKDWFHSSNDHNKHFWVMKFASDDNSNVTFDYADRIKANTPYLIAIPDNTWGSEWNLRGKTLVFQATNATVSCTEATTSGNYFKLTGVTQQETLNNIYTVNSSGNYFSLGQATVAPFRAYMQSVSGQGSVSVLPINGPGDLISKLTVKCEISDFTINSADQTFSYDEDSPDKMVYGNTIKGSFLITNNGTGASTTGINILLFRADYGDSDDRGIFTDNHNITIAAGDSQKLSFEFNNLNWGERYVLAVSYTNFDNNTNVPVTLRSGIYRTSRSVAVTLADGQLKEVEPLLSTVTIPEDAVSVDLRNCDIITDVRPSANRNCVYLLDENLLPPFGLSGCITIKGGHADKVNLTDGHYFCPTVPFTANEVSFTRTFTQGCDGNSGWTTLILPFNVEHITIDGIEESTNGHLLLKRLTADSADDITFEEANSIEANIPYIAAIANKEVDNGNNTPKERTLVLSAKNVTLTAGEGNITLNHYRMTGSTIRKTPASAYTLNEAGSAFEPTGTNVAPFQAWIEALATVTSPDALYIGEKPEEPTEPEDPTAISTARTKPDTRTIYTLDGRRMSNDRLPKGIYVDGTNGHKIVIR